MDLSLAGHSLGARPRLAVAAEILVAGAAAGLLVWGLAHTAASSCDRFFQSGDWPRAAAACQASYQQGGDPRDGIEAARAWTHLGDAELERAAELADRLLAGRFYGDAHAILGYVELRRGSAETARIHAITAFAAHVILGDERGQASDAVLLSQAAWKAGDFTAALAAADRGLIVAQRIRDPAREASAHLARADALRRMGDTRGAVAALTYAIARATDPCQQVWIGLKKAMCEMEAGQDGLALIEFAAVAQANRRCRDPAVSTSVAINQAWLLRHEQPLAAIAGLDQLPSFEQDDDEVLLLRGYLAADRGALAEADRYFVRAASHDALDADWPWEVVRARAELAVLRGGPGDEAVAENHYRRAIAMIAALRSTARERSAYLVASHRGPYDGLIALLARKGRWSDVLEVVLGLDASDMLRATAAEVVARDHTRLDIEVPAHGAAMVPHVTVDDVVSAWRSRELVIVIAVSPRQIGTGHERVYRLRIADGRITGEDVGDASAARKWADDLFADPADRDAARGLGRMIVPPGAAGETLHVLAIGCLAKVPLAALRDGDDSLSIGRRPLARVLALRASGQEAAGRGRSVVIADPQGDLARAAAEGAMVAEALGPGALVSGSGTSMPATRDRLWAARDAALLHVAGHVGVLGRWRALRLADGDVAPAEMVRQRLAPRIAVLAGCGSAAATDEEGWGSIAAALLESGTAVVIATDRSVRDAASLSLMRAFYAQSDWRSDPVRALARVQLGLDARSATSTDDATSPRSWAAFSVLARPPEAPARNTSGGRR